jgi:hypothetical protein
MQQKLHLFLARAAMMLLFVVLCSEGAWAQVFETTYTATAGSNGVSGN